MANFLVFATWLRTELAKQGISLARAADDLQSPLPTVSAWLDGTRFPSDAELRRLAEMLEIPIERLERLTGRRSEKD
ncbi:MAG TPA: helix-turn-helix transcriptional regulator [Dehalococcoidia bacterium]|nr:helix-turn-helix transcriptional regulator [Dehalococcoidia bacterium]